jgi:hypothetical protein
MSTLPLLLSQLQGRLHRNYTSSFALREARSRTTMDTTSTTKAEPQRYLLHLARTHPTFRIPDLDSCARFFGFGIRLLATGDHYIAGSSQPLSTGTPEWGVEAKTTRELEDAIGRGGSALVVIEFTEGCGVYQAHHGEVPAAVMDIEKTDQWARLLTTRCIMVK